MPTAFGDLVKADKGIGTLTGGTDTHLMLVDLRPKGVKGNPTERRQAGRISPATGTASRLTPKSRARSWRAGHQSDPPNAMKTRAIATPAERVSGPRAIFRRTCPRSQIDRLAPGRAGSWRSASLRPFSGCRSFNPCSTSVSGAERPRPDRPDAQTRGAGAISRIRRIGSTRCAPRWSSLIWTIPATGGRTPLSQHKLVPCLDSRWPGADHGSPASEPSSLGQRGHRPLPLDHGRWHACLDFMAVSPARASCHDSLVVGRIMLLLRGKSTCPGCPEPRRLKEGHIPGAAQWSHHSRNPAS